MKAFLFSLLAFMTAVAPNLVLANNANLANYDRKLVIKDSSGDNPDVGITLKGSRVVFSKIYGDKEVIMGSEQGYEAAMIKQKVDQIVEESGSKLQSAVDGAIKGLGIGMAGGGAFGLVVTSFGSLVTMWSYNSGPTSAGWVVGALCVGSGAIGVGIGAYEGYNKVKCPQKMSSVMEELINSDQKDLSVWSNMDNYHFTGLIEKLITE